MRTERQLQGNLKKKRLILLIKVLIKQKKTKHVDLHIEFTIDKGVNLQNNKIMQKLFQKFY